MLSTASIRLPMMPALIVVCLALPGARSDEPKKKEGAEETKSGKVIGVVTAKGKGFIEVKAFGEEKARKYYPRWIGATPVQGAGPEKKILALFEKLKVGDRIRLSWMFDERPRAVQIEILKRAGGEK
jgi:hypothetical protein